jgi:hypothetical protein
MFQEKQIKNLLFRTLGCTNPLISKEITWKNEVTIFLL